MIPQAGAAQGKTKPSKIVLIRPTGVCMTETGSSACVITHYSPRDRLPCDATLRLVADDAIKTETWLSSDLIGAIRSDSDGIEPAVTSGADYELAYRNVASRRLGSVRLLLAGDTPVVDFNRHAFVPAWRATVNASWLARLHDDWAAPWCEGKGKSNHINRDANKDLGLQVEPDRFTVRFDGAESAFNIDAQVHGPHNSRYRSIDVAPVLYQLSRARVVGPVSIAGNEHALVVEYTTVDGSMHIAVPTLNANNVLVATLFEQGRA
jgi:hypothetical protein